jgi:hypothetical protein
MKYFKLKKGSKITAEGWGIGCLVLDDTISFERKLSSDGIPYLSPIAPHPLSSIGFEEKYFDLGQLSFDF